MSNLYDEDFYYVCKNHKDKIETLRKDGLLDEYIGLMDIFKTNVVEFLRNHLPINSNTVHSMVIEFSITNFEIKTIKHELITASEYFNVPNILNKFDHVEIPREKYSGIKEISNNSFEYFWLAGRIFIEDKFKNNLEEFYKNNIYSVYRECLDKMYELKYNI